jgi:hypothetical protein
MMKQRSVQYWRGRDYFGSTTKGPRDQFLIFAFDATSPSQRFSMSVLSRFSRPTWRSTAQKSNPEDHKGPPIDQDHEEDPKDHPKDHLEDHPEDPEDHSEDQIDRPQMQEQQEQK